MLRKISITSIIISILFFVAKGILTTVDESGVLHDYIPLALAGFALLFIGIMGLIISICISLKKK